MGLANMISFGGLRQWLALGALAVGLAVIMVFGMNPLWVIAVSVLYIGYTTWSASAFFVREHNYSGGRIAAYMLPVGIAVVQALICAGVIWLIVASVRGLISP